MISWPSGSPVPVGHHWSNGFGSRCFVSVFSAPPRPPGGSACGYCASIASSRGWKCRCWPWGWDSMLCRLRPWHWDWLGCCEPTCFIGLGVVVCVAAASTRRFGGCDSGTCQITPRDLEEDPAASDLSWSPHWLWLLLPFTVAIVGAAMLPPIDFDVREYHLQAPKEFLSGGTDRLPAAQRLCQHAAGR